MPLEPLNATDHAARRMAQKTTAPLILPVVSAVLPDGSLVETVYHPEPHQTIFCVAKDGSTRYETSIPGTRQRLVPFSANNNLLRNEVVLLPSGPEDFGLAEQLLADVRAFVHKYVEVSPRFETIATYYVLLTWVYDAFNELPYLRLRGDPGSGKTRFLLTVGSLCYKPIFASGASTVSPLFRILDAVRGTLIIDEGDFRFSDEQAEIVKILNNGNARGFPVLRSESTSRREFSPTAYAVFGPKLVATRGYFQDRALESRCITEEMESGRLRDDIPISLPPTFKDEALSIRNRLLSFRFQYRNRVGLSDQVIDRSLEPRLNQVFAPLLSIVGDGPARDEMLALLHERHRELILERGMDTEAQVLEIIRDLQVAGQKLGIKEITSWFVDRFGVEYERKVNPRWIGSIIRQRLRLKTQKSHGVYLVPETEQPRLVRLFERFGVDFERTGDERVDIGSGGDAQDSRGQPTPSGGHGDLGDFPGDVPAAEGTASTA